MRLKAGLVDLIGATMRRTLVSLRYLLRLIACLLLSSGFSETAAKRNDIVSDTFDASDATVELAVSTTI
jgi:hypothetical protein